MSMTYRTRRRLQKLGVTALIVLVVLLSLSIAISQLADKCKRLTQANAILEKRVRDLEEKQ